GENIPAGDNGCACVRSSRRTVTDRTAADYQSAGRSLCSPESFRGCQRRRVENRHRDFARIEIRFARCNHSTRNFRAAPKYARARSAVASAVLSGFPLLPKPGCAEDSARYCTTMLSLGANLVFFSLSFEKAGVVRIRSEEHTSE